MSKRVELTHESCRWLSDHCRSVIVLDSQMERAKTMPDHSAKLLRQEVIMARATLAALETGDDE